MLSLVGIAVAGLALSSCSPPSGTPSAAPATTTTPSVAIPGEELQAWIRFRLLFGLRADVEWVIAVAADPAASSTGYNVPLLPGEYQQVSDQVASAERLVKVAREYGRQFPDAFAGAWVEPPTVVIAFSGHVAARRAEVSALFGSAAVVREVRYSLPELQALMAAVVADAEWFTTVGATFFAANLDENTNQVEVQYRAPSQAVEDAIREHFNRPDWMLLTWEGPGPWTGPIGDLELTVVDGQGHAVEILCLLRTDDPRVPGEPVERELPDGKCYYQALAATDWFVDITYLKNGRPIKITREFSVPAGGVVRLRVAVDP